MKYFTKLALASSALLSLLGGCGESTNKTVFGDTPKNEAIAMLLNTPYVVNQGDKITPDGLTEIVVDHVIDVNTKSVTLLSGSATLLRGAYAIQ